MPLPTGPVEGLGFTARATRNLLISKLITLKGPWRIRQLDATTHALPPERHLVRASPGLRVVLSLGFPKFGYYTSTTSSRQISYSSFFCVMYAFGTVRPHGEGRKKPSPSCHTTRRNAVRRVPALRSSCSLPPELESEIWSNYADASS